MQPLKEDFFARDARTVACELVGCTLVYERPEGRLSGRVVETEAYREDDPACHAWGLVFGAGPEANRGRRGYDLFGPPGMAYVYRSYGLHWLLNVVAEPEGRCGAVLIRAIEPLEGLPLMRALRPGVNREVDLTNGPGKLTTAYGIDGSLHRKMLTSPPVYFAEGARPAPEAIGVSGRIGISRGGELPWRYYLRTSKYVSRGPHLKM